MTVQHPIPPLFGPESHTLILGSFPSVKSREEMFFYHHPQNRFWKVLAAVYDCPGPETIAEKTALVLDHGLALWDVIAACDIEGSSDASIRGAVPNDLSPILTGAPIQRIFCNGATSWKLYQKHQAVRTGLPAVQLPSTSPANAAWRLPDLIQAWSVLREV